MRLIEIRTTQTGELARVTGTIERQRSGQRFECYFEYRIPDSGFPGNAADAFAAALLLPAMRAGEPLEIVPPISPRLAFNLPRIRDIFHTWWPDFPRIGIDLNTRADESRPRASGAATFFSGGVDSFYSLLKYRKGAAELPTPLSHIVFMKGIESRLEFKEHARESETWVQEVAAAAGVECIVGEGDIRTSLQGPEDNLHWERHYHGSALAAVALGLSHRLAYVCIPSAFNYNHLVSHGSTPLVDEMYSTENLYVLHDGAESTRANKIASIVKWDRDLVLNHLRVCIMNAGGAFNCGRCYKCVRTAIPLYVLGLWDRAHTFRDKSMDHWEQEVASDHLALINENLQFALENGGDSKIIGILKRARRWNQRRDKLLNLLGTSFSPLLPLAQRLRPSSHRIRALVAARRDRNRPHV
jgi:hypothetical protein